MQRIEQNVKIKVVGVGGAGGNAVQRMAEEKIEGAELLAVNTDVQALRRLKKVETLAIGQLATGGMGSGGNPEMGRKAVRESQDQVAQMLEGADLVFVAAGMGGGTGTGAAGRRRRDCQEAGGFDRRGSDPAFRLRGRRPQRGRRSRPEAARTEGGHADYGGQRPAGRVTGRETVSRQGVQARRRGTQAGRSGDNRARDSSGPRQRRLRRRQVGYGRRGAVVHGARPGQGEVCRAGRGQRGHIEPTVRRSALRRVRGAVQCQGRQGPDAGPGPTKWQASSGTPPGPALASCSGSLRRLGGAAGWRSHWSRRGSASRPTTSPTRFPSSFRSPPPPRLPRSGSRSTAPP